MASRSFIAAFVGNEDTFGPQFIFAFVLEDRN